jgi:hypothetical protein
VSASANTLLLGCSAMVPAVALLQLLPAAAALPALPEGQSEQQQQQWGLQAGYPAGVQGC